MGRRIAKSKRHKKIKAVDPFYKGERKKLLDKDADRINNKPSNPDNQEVPRKLKEIAYSVKQLKEGTLNIKTRSKRYFDEGDDYGPTVKGCERPIQSMPVFTKTPGETERNFLRRIHVASEKAIAEAKLEKKFNITIIDDKEEDASTVKQKFLLDAKPVVISKKLVSEAKKLKRKRFEEKRKAKKQANFEKHLDDFSHLKDEIRFGEVATEPPSMTFVPTKVASVTAIRKPGNKPLLLKELLNSKETADIRRDLRLTGKSPSDIDLTIKRKHLPVADRRKLETEREKAIHAYRILKKQQQMQKNACLQARRTC